MLTPPWRSICTNLRDWYRPPTPTSSTSSASSALRSPRSSRTRKLPSAANTAATSSAPPLADAPSWSSAPHGEERATDFLKNKANILPLMNTFETWPPFATPIPEHPLPPAPSLWLAISDTGTQRVFISEGKGKAVRAETEEEWTGEWEINTTTSIKVRRHSFAKSHRHRHSYSLIRKNSWCLSASHFPTFSF